MRLRYALLAAAFAASPALAQTQYADSSGGYVGLNAVSFNSNTVLSLDGSAGYRFSNGVDVGLRLGRGRGSSSSEYRFGPVAGISRPLGAGFVGRIEGAVLYETLGGDVASYIDGAGVEQGGFSYRFRNLSQDVTATISRPVRLFGSVAVRPTLGVFAAARQRLTFDYPPAEGQFNRSSGAAGLHVEIPVTFRLFGQDAAWVTTGRLALTGNPLYGGAGARSYGGGGLRLNF